ncbi:AAA family ATPase [Stratiformator vulcanicus]|uniref:AAA+ ATPase domain-containing protein n=1 Tax=Stratiformator vulcanicus TaxID=2527980 RepID=A0A517R6J5_9PLAN|nr:AAA family ATPase [Stratiformator vulcanicus]QDT39509.1 hypothetical protein Pan189_39170 [Stratiformator vulcanicus]
MYEDFFGLTRRPFATAPDTRCLIQTPPFATVSAEVVRSLSQDRGICVITGPSGAGKTLLCRHLAEMSAESDSADFSGTAVYLAGAEYPTRRSLLQSILYELDRPYTRMGEQELRLELANVARERAEGDGGLLLIVDDAHRLSERILNELAICSAIQLTEQRRIQVVLAGCPELEETIAERSLSDFSDRIGCFTSMGRLKRHESVDYLRGRIQWAGCDADAIFTEDALSAIAHIADGLPRSLNQLADHTLLLAFVAEQNPASKAAVLEALHDLRRLPVHWNEPPETISLSSPAATATAANVLMPADETGVVEAESIQDDEPAPAAFIEIGAEPADDEISAASSTEEFEPAESVDQAVVESQSDSDTQFEAGADDETAITTDPAVEDSDWEIDWSDDEAESVESPVANKGHDEVAASQIEDAMGEAISTGGFPSEEMPAETEEPCSFEVGDDFEVGEENSDWEPSEEINASNVIHSPADPCEAFHSIEFPVITESDRLFDTNLGEDASDRGEAIIGAEASEDVAETAELDHESLDESPRDISEIQAALEDDLEELDVADASDSIGSEASVPDIESDNAPVDVVAEAAVADSTDQSKGPTPLTTEAVERMLDASPAAEPVGEDESPEELIEEFFDEEEWSVDPDPLQASIADEDESSSPSDDLITAESPAIAQTEPIEDRDNTTAELTFEYTVDDVEQDTAEETPEVEIGSVAEIIAAPPEPFRVTHVIDRYALLDAGGSWQTNTLASPPTAENIEDTVLDADQGEASAAPTADHAAILETLDHAERAVQSGLVDRDVHGVEIAGESILGNRHDTEEQTPEPKRLGLFAGLRKERVRRD